MLLPESVKLPLPVLVMAELPETTPEAVSAAVPTLPPEFTDQVWFAPRVILEEIVWVVADEFAVLVTVIAGFVPPKVILPPERVILLAEPELTKVSEFALTAPETVIVPVPSWFALVPKFKASDVVVVVVPERAVVPVEEVVQP